MFFALNLPISLFCAYASSTKFLYFSHDVLCVQWETDKQGNKHIKE